MSIKTGTNDGCRCTNGYQTGYIPWLLVIVFDQVPGQLSISRYNYFREHCLHQCLYNGSISVSSDFENKKPIISTDYLCIEITYLNFLPLDLTLFSELKPLKN